MRSILWYKLNIFSYTSPQCCSVPTRVVYHMNCEGSGRSDFNIVLCVQSRACAAGSRYGRQWRRHGLWWRDWWSSSVFTVHVSHLWARARSRHLTLTAPSTRSACVEIWACAAPVLGASIVPLPTPKTNWRSKYLLIIKFKMDSGCHCFQKRVEAYSLFMKKAWAKNSKLNLIVVKIVIGLLKFVRKDIASLSYRGASWATHSIVRLIFWSY